MAKAAIVGKSDLRLVFMSLLHAVDKANGLRITFRLALVFLFQNHRKVESRMMLAMMKISTLN